MLASLTAGGVIAAAHAVFPHELKLTTILLPGVLGCAVGYFCVGPTALLAASGILPIVVVSLWMYFADSSAALQPPWFYGFALVATVFAGAVALSAIGRAEDDAP